MMIRYVSWIQQKDGSCFQIQSVSLYLFTGENETSDVDRYNDQCLLIPFILFLWNGGRPLFEFAGLGLFIHRVSLGILNLFRLKFSSTALCRAGFVVRYC